MSRPRSFFVAAVTVTGLAIVSSACASYGVLSHYPAPVPRVDDRAYRIGFEEGREEGERDGRRQVAYDYARHNEFRDADRGYRGGDRSAYRSVFRRGFMDGYRDGYRRYGPAFPGRYDRARARFASPAAEHGYRDGYDQGRDDRRDRDAYDPVRARRYRSADNDYKGSYGSRDLYKRQYRDAFLQGYERGYREG